MDSLPLFSNQREASASDWEKSKNEKSGGEEGISVKATADVNNMWKAEESDISSAEDLIEE
jgi:hypothetical protein